MARNAVVVEYSFVGQIVDSSSFYDALPSRCACDKPLTKTQHPHCQKNVLKTLSKKILMQFFVEMFSEKCFQEEKTAYKSLT